MYAKLCFGQGLIIIKEIEELDCPNMYGGIGYIKVKPADVNLWTGDTHISAPYFQIHFGSLTQIETRKTLNETNEKWKIIWKYEKPFTYAQFFKAAKILNRKFGRR